jgi:integrase
VITGLHIVRAKTLKAQRWYIYAWRGGPRIGLRIGESKPLRLTADEVVAFYAAKAASQVKPTNTVAALIRDYRASPEWGALAKKTASQWGRHLDRIEERWGGVPLKVMSDRRMVPKVIAWRDEKSATPRTADYQIGVLRQLLTWGEVRGFISFNAAGNIPRLYRGACRALILWADEDVERFVSETAVHIGDIIRLATVTGFRAGDLAALTWDEVSETAICRTAEKRSRGQRRAAIVPLIPSAAALLDELRSRPRMPGVNTVLVNSLGRAWSVEGLSGTVSREVTRLNICHTDGRRKHLHDTRGTMATALFAAGLSDEEVAEVLAWSPKQVESIRHHYVDREQRIVAMAERLAVGAVKRGVKSLADR